MGAARLLPCAPAATAWWILLAFNTQPVSALQIETTQSPSLQVQSVHCNPVDANLVMTAGNDYTARVVDMRNLMGGEPQLMGAGLLLQVPATAGLAS